MPGDSGMNFSCLIGQIRVLSLMLEPGMLRYNPAGKDMKETFFCHNYMYKASKREGDERHVKLVGFGIILKDSSYA